MQYSSSAVFRKNVMVSRILGAENGGGTCASEVKAEVEFLHAFEMPSLLISLCHVLTSK
jgi:hypothetical protein